MTLHFKNIQILQVTGGRSYAVTSQRVLHQCIDSLVQKLQPGVVIHFEKVGPDPPPVRDGENTPDEDSTPLLRLQKKSSGKCLFFILQRKLQQAS
jgi:hypothetical protein